MPSAGIDVPPIRSFRVGAMGSASLFERLDACLAEERAELEKRHGLLLKELMADHPASHDMLRRPEPNEVPVPFNGEADGNGPPLASPLASTSSIADVFGQLPKTANPSLDCATTLLLDEAKEEDNFERLGSNPETLPGSVKMKVFLTYK
ncbi:unnamed protein product [Cladocopium goreaui]|uniref:Uncharacterized protein n=1 Tax=Cladocopium goreaui TaxID=2562237 RepID=A0A9P1DEY3_9DINO|nr:unnamed protein product [Cladocopium goreaui]